MLRTLFASLALLAAQSAAAPMLNQMADNQFAQIEGPSVAELRKAYEPKPEAEVVLDGGKNLKPSAKIAALAANYEPQEEAAPVLDGGPSGEGVSPGIQARIDKFKASQAAPAPKPKAAVGKKVVRADDSWIKK